MPDHIMEVLNGGILRGFFEKLSTFTKYCLGLLIIPVVVLCTSGYGECGDGRLDESFILHMAARNATKAGIYKRAIERYRRLITKYPHILDARKELAWVLVKTGRLEEAMKEYQEVIKVKPNDVPALRGLLDVLRRLKRKDRLLDILERLVSLVPDDRDLRVELAVELHNRGMYLEAEKHLIVLLGEDE